MTLREFIEGTNGLDMAKFAERINVTHEAVRLYCDGNRVPKPAVMRKIIVATAGAVQPNDFFKETAA